MRAGFGDCMAVGVSTDEWVMEECMSAMRTEADWIIHLYERV